MPVYGGTLVDGYTPWKMAQISPWPSFWSTFGDVHEYDTMIHYLYEIRQKEGESMEEYMLWIHEAVAVICCAYPDWVIDQGKNLAWDRFYHGLTPSLQNALGFRWQSCLRGSRLVPASTHCIHWPRRWRHGSLHVHTEVCQDLLTLIEISTGDTLPLWDGLQCWKRRNRSYLMLNHQTLRCPSQMSSRHWALEWLRQWTTTRGRNAAALCVEQPITLQEIALIERPSGPGIRSI